MNALKILSMRLRGTEAKKLQDMGEDTDGLITSTSKLRDTIKSLSGVDIMLPDGKTFKSTYDIMKEISKVYNDLADIDKANLLETIAGKNRSSDIQALLGNFAQVEKATTSAINAEGSAMEEYKIHMDTVQASLNALKSTWQEFANTFLKAKDLKVVIDTLKVLLELLNQIVDKVGVLPLLGMGTGFYLSKKKNFDLFGTIKNLFNTKDIDNTSKTFGNLFGEISKSSKGANTGVKNVAESTKILGEEAKGASISVSLLNGLLTGLALAGISLAIKGIDYIANKGIEASKEANDEFNKTSEELEKITSKNSSLDELINKYKELKKSGEVTPEVNSQIVDIQSEITNLVGKQADNLDLVNGKLDNELDKLNEIQKKESENAKEKASQKYYDSKEASKKANGDISGSWSTGFRETDVSISKNDKAYDIIRKNNKNQGIDYYKAGWQFINEKLLIDTDFYNGKKIDNINAEKRANVLKEYMKIIEDNLDNPNESKGYRDLAKKVEEYDEYKQKQIESIGDFINSEISYIQYDKDLKSIDVNSAESYDKYLRTIKDKIKNTTEIKDALNNNLISDEDIETSVLNYMSGLDGIGQYHKQWLKEYQKDEKDNAEKVKQYRSYDVVDNLADKKGGISSYQKIIAESNSSTGLSSDMISEVEKLYSNLDGYDASKIFEKTANGIQVNRKELEKLQNQYLKEDLNQNYMALAEMTNEYKSLEVAIASCANEKEKEALVNRRDTLKGKIEETARLTSQYEALTSAYNKWIIAQNTENEGAKYDAYAGYLDQLKELNKKGLIGTDDYQSAVQLMSYEDLSGKSAGEYQKIYQKQLPMIKKYFNGQKTGILSFFKDINKQHPNWAKIENGQWVVDLGVNGADKLAKELGVSVDLIEMLLKKSADYGANVNLSYFENDLQSIITHAKTANEALNEMGNTTHTFNFDATSIEEVNKELGIAKELYNKLPKNQDGTINVNAEGAKETISVLTALIRKKQELEDNNIAIFKIDKKKIKKDTSDIVNDLANLKSNMNEYSLNLNIGGDTDTFKNNITEIIKNIEATNPQIRASLNLDNYEFVNAIENIQSSINVGAEIKEEDVNTIVKYLSGITPEMVVDAKVNDKKVKEYQKTTKKAKGELVWSNNTSKVDSYKRKEQKANGVVKWINDRGSVLTRFDATGTIDWKNNKVTNPLLRNPYSDGSARTYVSGSAYANGKKSGNWSVGVSGKALVGELGAEIKVSNGKWELVGADSAEFVDVKNNDIIFNAKQTQQLFKYGKIINGKSRGRSLANGSAFADGSVSGYAFGNSSTGMSAGGSSSSTKKKKTTTKKSSSKSKSKSSSKSKSKSSSKSKADKTKETFDWIEIAIERIENAISDLDKIAGSAYYSFTTRNKKLKSEYSMISKEITMQQKAYARYKKEADAVGLNSTYKKAVQKGTINISKIGDEKLAQKIKDYQTWYEKMEQCKDSIVDLRMQQYDLRKNMFDNVANQYDSYIGRIEKQKTYLDNYISRAESKGNVVSTKYYSTLISKEQESLNKLTEERKLLYNSLNSAINNGDVAKGSDAWYEMQGKIDDVTESIQMATNNIIEFKNEIRNIQWGNFDYLHETISQAIDESDFLISLFENKDLFDDKGIITNYGTSTMGLNGLKYNVYMQQSQSYARELERLNKEIAKTPNDKELIARRNEIISQQREMILNAQSEKQAMIDLAREGYDKQLESLQDLIDKYNEAIESERDLYEYQKNIKDQTKEIANIQKQLSSYQNDNSEETKAKVQQLKVQLEEAKDNLKETQFDRYISDQQELLDGLYDNYEEFIDNKFKDVDVLFSELIDGVNTNATTISDTLAKESEKVGYTLTDNMNSIWKTESAGETHIKNVLSDFSGGFSEFSGKFDTYTQNSTTTIESWLGTINSNLVAMVNASNKTATEDIRKTTSTAYTATGSKTNTPKSNSTTGTKTNTKQSSNSNSNSSSKTGSKSKTLGYISNLVPIITSSSSSSYIKRVQTALKALGFKGKDKKSLAIDGKWGSNTDYAVKSFQRYNKWGGAITADGKIGKNTKAKFRKAGYKKGIYKTKQDEFAWTQENRIPETIIRKSDGAILTPLNKGDTVFNGNATSNLWDMGNNPSKFIRDNLSGTYDVANGNNVLNNQVTNDINMNITLPNVKNYNEFVNELQRDSKFERMIQDMTINQLSGRSSLSKFKYKFK